MSDKPQSLVYVAVHFDNLYDDEVRPLSSILDMFGKWIEISGARETTFQFTCTFYMP